LSSWRTNVYPISDKEDQGGISSVLRVYPTVLVRELNLWPLLGDMYSVVTAAYATLVGYDEVAHHSGVEAEWIRSTTAPHPEAGQGAVRSGRVRRSAGVC